MKFVVNNTIKPSEIYYKENATSFIEYCTVNNVNVIDFRPPREGDVYIAMWRGKFLSLNYHTYGFEASNVQHARYIAKPITKQSVSDWE